MVVSQFQDGTLTERHLSREMLGVVEATAIAAARTMGNGDEVEVDRAARTAMHECLEQITMEGEIVIGETKLPEIPGLKSGETVGQGSPPSISRTDIALNAVEGAKLVAKGLPNAISCIALSSSGGLFKAPECYMRKLIVGPLAKGKVDINAPVRYNLSIIAMSLERNIEDITVVILDRPRHDELIAQVRDCGARIKLIADGDVMPAITTCLSGAGIHAVMGIGGAPQGVLAAAAVKCLGGEIQTQLCWFDDEQRKTVEAFGIDADPDNVYLMDDLVPGDEIVFAASGVTHGDTLKGVRYFGSGARTHSIVMTLKSGLIRFVDTVHLHADNRGPVKI